MRGSKTATRTRRLTEVIPTPDNIYKAAIYCRLSEEDKFKANADDDSNSIANQKSMLTQYCLEKGWEIFGVYSDDDFTGSDRNRPAFNRLIRDAEAHRFDVVVCKTQSRFTREIELVEKYINYLFPLWGVRFVSIVDNADTAVKGNKKARQINGLINEWYLEDMSDNIKAVLTSRRREGLFIGAFAPYGYKKDPEQKGHLVVDEEAAAVVRKIFALYLSGLGRTAIARELNRLHIPTPADYKISNGENYKNGSTAKRSKQWRYFMVGNILTNEVYIGNLVQNKAHSVSYKSKKVKPTDRSDWIRVENTHAPIIDRETWYLAQSILEARPKPSFERRSVNVFARKVFCSECGRSARVSKGSSSANGRRYLRCSTRYYAPDECEGMSVSYDRLCGLVLAEFRKITAQMLDVERVAGELSLTDRSKEQTANLEREEARLEKLVSENAQYLKTLYIDKVKGVIDEGTYIELSRSFSEESKSNEELLALTRERLSRLRGQGARTEAPADIVRRHAEPRELTFEMVQVFIEKIVVHPKKPYSRRDEIDIYWNF